MYRNRPVSLALVGLFLWVTACSSYKYIGLSEVADYGKVRVFLTDGEHETIHDPRVEADSIKGDDGPPSHKAQSIPLDQMIAVEGRSPNVTGTAFVVLGVSVLVLAILCAAACDFEFGGG